MLAGQRAVFIANVSVRQSRRVCFSTDVNVRRSTSAAPFSVDQHPELFAYTSGRWLYNEAQRLEERHLEFDVPALKEAASGAVGRGVSDVRSFVKIAEGGFNRIFNVTMKDGLEVIVRLPYSVTQPRRLAVASEVATMDFLRAHGLPIPQIYGYNIDSDNPVGSEYILMEKVNGRPLANAWYSLTDKQQIRLLSQIVETEAKIFDLNFPAYGSIFYEKDLPQGMGRMSLNLRDNLASPYCVGPDVSLKHWFERRSSLDIPRGPAITSTEVLQNAAKKEIAFLRRFGKPRLPCERSYRDITNFQKSEPQGHLDNLYKFLQVCPHLVPDDNWLQKPILRHPDLSPHNIFISEDTKITGIIDWQHSCILPFFLNAGIPAHFSNYGDPDSEALNRPQLPDNLDELDEHERGRDLELYRRRHLHFYYVGATARKANQHYKAMMHEGNMFRQQIFRDASAPWEGDNIALQAALVRLVKSWHDLIPSSPQCPISFTDEHAEWTLQAMEKQSEADDQMRILRDVIVGVGTDGWVANERYPDTFSKAAALKKDAIAVAEDGAELEEIKRTWPFDDYDESE